MHEQRRDFLKIAAAGATGLAMSRATGAWGAWPGSGTLEINPSISNLRVVACKDAAMMKTTPTTMSFAAENAAVDAARVQANLDAMAMRLANTTTADAAWKLILRSSRPWATTVVAIKINATESKNMPRVAIVEKLCRVLSGFGVPASNLIIYDSPPSTFTSSLPSYATYFSTTDTAKIPGVVSNVNDALGGTTNAATPNGTAIACTANIANGKVDILINVAVNKGHPYFGRATLCMKNHFGTFTPNHNDIANYIFNLNKSDAILGGNPVRQQLCIVDSLIANKNSNNGTPEAMPNYLVMGTFAPAVDYLTVKKIREEVMSCSHDGPVIDSYMTSFGYTTADPQWLLVDPASATADAGGSGGASAGGASGRGGGSGAGGSQATGGAGGTRSSAGSGGANSGGVTETGGAGRGGAPGAGGGPAGTGGQATSGAGGAGGGSVTGGQPGQGGRGVGGAQNGGTTSGGGGAGGGEGGTLTSSFTSAGGAPAGSGPTGGGTAGAQMGCSCRLGSAPARGGGLGLLMALATFVSRRLRR